MSLVSIGRIRLGLVADAKSHGCACSPGPATATWWLGLGFVALGFRRRRV